MLRRFSSVRFLYGKKTKLYSVIAETVTADSNLRWLERSFQNVKEKNCKSLLVGDNEIFPVCLLKALFQVNAEIQSYCAVSCII